MANKMFNKEELADMPTAKEAAPEPVDNILSMVDSGMALMMAPDKFEQMQRIAKVYAASDLVPKQFQGKIGNVVIAMNLAQRLGVDLFMLMQNMYVVHGRPGFEAKLMIALVNSRGPFTGPIQWRSQKNKAGKIVSMTAFAKHKQTGEVCEATVDVDMVTSFGWDKEKKGKSGWSEPSKWVQMPEQMYCYRSAAFLVRKYCPEVLLGLQTTDELEDAVVSAPDTSMRFKTVGEAAVYAASIGIPDEDLASMVTDCEMTKSPKTHTPEKLDHLAVLIDQWAPEQIKMEDPLPAPTEEPKAPEGKIHVVDETKPAPKKRRSKNSNVDEEEINELRMLGRESGKAEDDEALRVFAENVICSGLEHVGQLTHGEYKDVVAKLTGGE